MRLSGNKAGGGSSLAELTGIYVQVTAGIHGEMECCGLSKNINMRRAMREETGVEASRDIEGRTSGEGQEVKGPNRKGCEDISLGDVRR